MSFNSLETFTRLRAVSLVFAVWSACTIGWSSAASADEKLKDIACRSVHLGYEGEEMLAFYHEIEVQDSAPGTYFAVCGWDAGYFGIQELGHGKK